MLRAPVLIQFCCTTVLFLFTARIDERVCVRTLRTMFGYDNGDGRDNTISNLSRRLIDLRAVVCIR